MTSNEDYVYQCSSNKLLNRQSKIDWSFTLNYIENPGEFIEISEDYIEKNKIITLSYSIHVSCSIIYFNHIL